MLLKALTSSVASGCLAAGLYLTICILFDLSSLLTGALISGAMTAIITFAISLLIGVFKRRNKQ